MSKRTDRRPATMHPYEPPSDEVIVAAAEGLFPWSNLYTGRCVYCGDPATWVRSYYRWMRTRRHKTGGHGSYQQHVQTVLCDRHAAKYLP
jgi:hypothetical protein